MIPLRLVRLDGLFSARQIFFLFIVLFWWFFFCFFVFFGGERENVIVFVSFILSICLGNL